jgi:NADH:ubiquinone oxidoreductase subunit 5 (subunit L)/multisubunit Na+/H+ antiporter MnhA subunit
VHHAFAKAALFLGVPAVWAVGPGALRVGVIALLAIPALALAGLPGTSGWVAKGALKAALQNAPEGWAIWLGAALFVASLGTAFLMLRALFLLAVAAHKPKIAQDVALPWLTMTTIVIFGLTLANVAPDATEIISMADFVPLAAAGGLAAFTGVIFHYAGLRLEPAAQGELMGKVRNIPQLQPVPLRIAPKQAHPFGAGRPAAVSVKPERGALAILSMAAALVLFMVLVPAPAPVPEPIAPDSPKAE